jgi:hypothetical protein
MKNGGWKAATVSLLCVLSWLIYSVGRSEAQTGAETYHVTAVESRQLEDATRYKMLGGDVQVPGKEIKGFSCVSDVDGHLDKDGGRISSDVECYVLSK